MVGPVAKREAVVHLQAVMGLSERRACSVVGADRKMIRYRSRRAPETELRDRLRDLANERRRFGYRRLFILLRREGERSGINRIYRLYREEGLTVRKRRASAGCSPRAERRNRNSRGSNRSRMKVQGQVMKSKAADVRPKAVTGPVNQNPGTSRGFPKGS